MLFAFPAAANITTASITGRVTAGGAPAYGVTVLVASSALQEPRVTITNRGGRYWIGALPPGDYDVKFELEGHTTLVRRATLELGRVARADATLEANTDEDTITSTAKTISVADTLPITSHFDDRLLDRLPRGRLGSASLAPGGQFGMSSLVDGVASGAVTSEETVQQITVLRGAAPVEWESFIGTATAVRTRTGGEDFSVTLRDTITDTGWVSDPGFGPRTDDGLMHFGEATIGGRIVPQRLWFFAAAWRGEQAFSTPQQFEGTMARADVQIGTAHHLDLSYNDTSQRFALVPFDSDTASLRYTAAAGAFFTSELFAARTTIGSGGNYEASTDFYSWRGSYTLGDHIVTAGFSSHDGAGPDSRSFFASDRFSYARLNVYAGLRYDDAEFADGVSPRVALAYDLLGNGARAITAGWGEYAPAAQPNQIFRTLSVGYASAIGSSGALRVDALHTDAPAFDFDQLQLDARYRLFDRIEAGATYTFSDFPDNSLGRPFFPDHIANVWLGAELPIGSHEFGATLLQRYTEVGGDAVLPTDLALRYRIPLPRVSLDIAADVLNVFDAGNLPRAPRLWLRLHL